MKNLRGVGVIVEANGKILMLQRKPSDSYGEKWCLPGGEVEEGETFEEGGLRELEEETGFVTKDVESLGVFNEGGKFENVTFEIFKTKCDEEFVPKLSHEHTAYEWLTPKELIKKDDLIFQETFVSNIKDIYPDLVKDTTGKTD